MSEAHSITQSSSTQSEKVEVSANPTKEITCRHVWEKIHTKKDDTISDTACSYFDKIAKAKETINDSDEEDKRGRTRSIETKISRTQLKTSTIARKQFKKTQGDSKQLKVRIENIERKLKMMVDLSKRCIDQGNRIPDIAFNVGGSGTRQESVGRMLNIDVADQLNSPGSTNQKCEILNYDLEVIATGSVCKDSATSIMHGKPIPPTHKKLVVDNILLPDEKTTKQNHPLAMTFAEVGIGGYVYHPKNAIQYL